MSDTLRAFVALPLSDGARGALLDVGKRCRAIADDRRIGVRWSRDEQLHVTAKFVGAIERDREGDCRRIVDEVAAAAAPVETTLDAVTVFGRPRRARVLVVRMGDPGGRLAALAARLDAAFGELGVQRETRSFTAHVTLGRFRKPSDATPILDAATFEPMRERFSALRLYESKLSPKGATYAVLHEAALSG